MATRFVKGASGNPSGRPKHTQSRMTILDLADRLRERSGRARDHGIGGWQSPRAIAPV